MRSHSWLQTRIGKLIAVVIALAAAAALVGALVAGTGSPASAAIHPQIEASIFSYDGSDFVRTQTTLMNEKGKSAVNTKLDRSSPAFKALADKHSYVGEATVFGRKYDADYAPLTGSDGQLTGALFVGVAK
jgi:hypothetical protein